MSGTQTIDLGPTYVETDAGDPFLLQKAEFLALQLYIAGGMRLPKTSLEWLRSIVPCKQEKDNRYLVAATGFPLFVGLHPVFKDVREACTNYHQTFLSGCKTFAEDVIAYSKVVDIYYQQLDQAVHSNEGQSGLHTILQSLQQEVKKYIPRSKDIYERTHTFMLKTEQAHKAFAQKYELMQKRKLTKFGAHAFVVSYQELDSIFAEARKWDASYNEQLARSGQSASYIWQSLAGPIPAPPHDEKARALIQRMAVIQEKVEKAHFETAWKALICIGTHTLGNRVTCFRATASQALVTLQRMTALWQSIAQDIDELQSRLDRDVQQTRLTLQKLGLKNAIGRWRDVAKKAGQYKDTQGITLNDESVVSSH